MIRYDDDAKALGGIQWITMHSGDGKPRIQLSYDSDPAEMITMAVKVVDVKMQEGNNEIHYNPNEFFFTFLLITWRGNIPPRRRILLLFLLHCKT